MARDFKNGLTVSGGQVGIGTTPSEILHISKTTGNFTTIRFDSATTQGYFFAYDGDNSVNIGSNSNSQLNLRVNNATKASLDANGNLTLVGRHNPRVGSTTSSATPTINTDLVDFYELTAQAAAITSFTTNLSGTPTNFQPLWIAITGTAARAITWGTSFENGAVTLPTTTVGTTRLDVAFRWNAATSKWRCMAAG